METYVKNRKYRQCFTKKSPTVYNNFRSLTVGNMDFHLGNLNYPQTIHIYSNTLIHILNRSL
jgi:hypothetical protein